MRYRVISVKRWQCEAVLIQEREGACHLQLCRIDFARDRDTSPEALDMWLARKTTSASMPFSPQRNGRRTTRPASALEDRSAGRSRSVAFVRDPEKIVGKMLHGSSAEET